MGIVLIYSILNVLLSNAVNTRRDKTILYSRTTIPILITICYHAFENMDFKSLSEGIGLFGGLFHISVITLTFIIFINAISAIILHLTAFYPRKVWKKEYSSLFLLLSNKLVYPVTNILNKMASQYRIMEYPLIILFIITGASFLINSSDIISIFLSIELQSYGLYLICSLYRNSELSTSAGLTYFLLGGLASCFILLGTSLLYVNSGSTTLDNFYMIINISNMVENDSNVINLYGINYIQFSLLIMTTGFLFKISAAPFHFWSPDVYDAIPTIVTTFVAIIAKISILVFLLELIYYTAYTSNWSWTAILLFSSFLSLVIGTVLGLNQSRVKRLYAYSTISHLGFILLALGVNSIESIQAFIFYIMQYSISNLNAFIILIAIGYSLYMYINKEEKLNLADVNNSPVQFISQLKGYFNINPLLAISLAITIYSFVGIPPLLGFFAKQMVLSSALSNGYIFITFVAIITSVISAVYYLSIIKQMFFDVCDYEINPYFNNILSFSVKNTNIKSINYSVNNILLSSSLTIIISTLTLIILLFMLNPQEWLSLANMLALTLYNF